MHTTHAILSAVKTPLGHRFLALGVDSSGCRYVALVPSLTSILRIPIETAVPCDLPTISDDTVLILVAAQLVAMTIIDPMCTGQKVLLHNASHIIAQAISTQASVKEVEVTYTTDNQDSASIPSGWIRLSPYLGRYELSQRIPASVMCFVGFSTHDSESELAIASILSQYCHRENSKTLYAPQSTDTGNTSAITFGHILKRAVKDLRTEEYEPVPKPVSLETLASKDRPDDPLTVIDWTTATTLPARARRFDIASLFRTDKTYWLCGLSGALGISLCDWMIDRGVRNLVLTSRNPKVDQAWIKDHARNGVIVKTLSW